MKRLTKEQKRVIFFWIVVILIAPFAFEVLFLAEILGAETAVFFVLYYAKDLWGRVKEKWLWFKAELICCISILLTFGISSPRNITAKYAISLAFFVVTGSFFYSVLALYPAIMLETWVFGVA